jgi:microsomal dipeptidase-like Zn-dependent dipeptidase
VDLVGNHQGNPGPDCADDSEATQCRWTWRGSAHLPRPTLEADGDAILDRLQALGVRLITPVHLADNGIGGSAVFNPLFNSNNHFLNGSFYAVETAADLGVDFAFDPVQRFLTLSTGRDAFVPVTVYADIPAPHVNQRGLTADGRRFLEGMMRRGLLIDVDHMSQHTADNVLGVGAFAGRGVVVPAPCTDFKIAACRTASYPVVSSHSSFRDPRLWSGDPGYEPGHRSEGDKTREQVQRIRDIGGIVAPITRQAAIRTPDPRWSVADACPDTSWSFAQTYLDTVRAMGGQGVGIGTDFNGLNTQPEGRMVACTGRATATAVPYELLASLPGATRAAHAPLVPSGISSGGILRLLDVNVDGLAHYGLLPDFVQDVRDQGVSLEELAPLFRSAEDFIRTWEKACRWRDLYTPGFVDHACR